MEPNKLKLKPSAVLNPIQHTWSPPSPRTLQSISPPPPPPAPPSAEPLGDQDIDSVESEPVELMNSSPSKILLVLDIIVICVCVSLGLYIFLYK